jgi:hypothetical protein
VYREQQTLRVFISSRAGRRRSQIFVIVLKRHANGGQRRYAAAIGNGMRTVRTLFNSITGIKQSFRR